MNTKGKTLEDLRDGLFYAIEALKRDALSVDQAKAIAGLGSVFVQAAKVEADFITNNNKGGTPVRPTFLSEEVERVLNQSQLRERLTYGEQLKPDNRSHETGVVKK